MEKSIPVNKNVSVQKRIKNNLAERGVKGPNVGLTMEDPKRRRTVANMILGGSPDQMRNWHSEISMWILILARTTEVFNERQISNVE